MQNRGTLHVSAQGDREIVLRRVFNAPAQFVFDAFTKCDLLKRWMGPHGHSLIECSMDLRPGGKWHWVLLMPGDLKMGMRGEIRIVDPPRRVVHTEGFFNEGDISSCGVPEDVESIITTTFAEANGQTTVEIHCLYDDRETRDAVIASGMEHGAAESYDKLGALIAAELGKADIEPVPA